MKGIAGKRIVFGMCLAIMIGCLTFEGFVLAAEGFPYYEHLTLIVRVLGLVWVLTVASCFVYYRRPIFAIIGGGGIFIINSISLWRSDAETHQLDWFLYMHSVELLFLVAACLGPFTKGARRV